MASLVLACAGGSSVEGSPCANGVCPDHAVDGGSNAPQPDVSAQLAVTPSNAVLNTQLGQLAELDFTVTATYADGTTGEVQGFWAASSPRIGTINRTTGTFSASGAGAGTVDIQVTALGRSVTVPLRVAVTATSQAPGVPADPGALFAAAEAPDPTQRANLVYPPAGAVLPQNISPADVQWDRGSVGDVYRISLSSSAVEAVHYELHTGPAYQNHWPVDAPLWRALAEATPEQPVTVRVDRWEAATNLVRPGVARTFRFADAVLRGSIYYWALRAGRIVRISDGGTRENFMPTPPLQNPADPASSRCVACHTVSRDGTRMAVSTWSGEGRLGLYDLTQDLVGDPPPALRHPVSNAGPQMYFGSFSPDNSRILTTSAVGVLSLRDGATGDVVATGGAPLPSAAATFPSWSPDGSSVALVNEIGNANAIDYPAGALSLIDVTGPDSFSAVRELLPYDGVRVYGHPSWTPDSQWIAYHHGDSSRAFQVYDFATMKDVVPSVRRDGRIMMVSRDGTRRYRLENLNGAAENSYYPTLSPFNEGGYFWLAFFSTRDYGNASVGTKGEERRQLWVSAISNNPQPGQDPSAPAFWLPGQDQASDNMAAFWAQEACRGVGATCNSSGECCGDNFCRDHDANQSTPAVCVAPSEVTCSLQGESCSQASDCCAPQASCSSNVCTLLL